MMNNFVLFILGFLLALTLSVSYFSQIERSAVVIDNLNGRQLFCELRVFKETEQKDKTFVSYLEGGIYVDVSE